MKFSCTTLLCVSTSFLGLSSVSGHGYVTISRNNKCKTGANRNCGQTQYEPQSLEALKGYPGSGPPDGQLASAGLDLFAQLDEQTSWRWDKTYVSSGPRSFTWRCTACHRTTGYQYYITRNGWNPNAPLTRAQFESQPFCTASGGGRQPSNPTTHQCNLPSRSGYHVVLAVWTIDDTAHAFYNVIDLNFGGAQPTAPTPTTPTITPPTPPSGQGTCGGGHRGDGVCANGMCCSKYGWCGTSSAHCSGSGTCGGGSRGDGKCADGSCCSKYGWCGWTSAHCN